MPELPHAIQTVVEQSWAAAQADPMGHLEIGYRLAIYAALGMADPTRGAVTSVLIGSEAGLLRRCRLRLLAAKRTLPIWDTYIPSDDTPYRTLAACDRYLEQVEAGTNTETAEMALVQEYLYNLEGYYDRYFYQETIPDVGLTREQWQLAVSAGHLTEFLLRELIGEVELWRAGESALEETEEMNLPTSIDFTLQDVEWDAQDRGVEYTSAQAYCGIACDPYETTDPVKVAKARERNLSYWQWWLTEAVPAAYAYRPDAAPV